MEKTDFFIYLILFILFYKSFFISEKMTDDSISSEVDSKFEKLLEDIRYISKITKKITSTNELEINNDDGLTADEIYFGDVKLKYDINNGLIINNGKSELQFKSNNNKLNVNTPQGNIFFEKKIYNEYERNKGKTTTADVDENYRYILQNEGIYTQERDNFQLKGNYELANDHVLKSTGLIKTDKDGAFFDIVKRQPDGTLKIAEGEGNILECSNDHCTLKEGSKIHFKNGHPY